MPANGRWDLTWRLKGVWSWVQSYCIKWNPWRWPI